MARHGAKAKETGCVGPSGTGERAHHLWHLDPDRRTAQNTPRHGRTNGHSCGEPRPGADVAEARPVPVQLWQQCARSWCRCGQGPAQFRCRCGSGEPSPSARRCAQTGSCVCGFCGSATRTLRVVYHAHACIMTRVCFVHCMPRACVEGIGVARLAPGKSAV
jgi:hypothetical protein